ncbi:C40 family peptidase [Streptomyces niveiscabiei]|uniref:C40 family peptidase n=1 Tax=Streptomyces niveiscabiei TaxID=164115 RepID=UPI0029A0B48D|nr:C40 family peptidase [Streptomyces niveiscabiei]MDX3383655.1 C40 family peptidase [Streptomyces niveiscabiei]
MEELLIPVGLMSHTAHIRSHRKPRRNASSIAVRAGVASGVLGTLAVATAAGSANAADATVTQTLELPTLTADLSAQVEQAAQFTQQAAANYQLQAERDSAAAAAAKEAAKDLAAAKQAEAKKKAAEEARKAAAEAAVSRSETRASLSGSSSSDSVATPASGSVATVIDFLKAQVGDAYVLGGTGPNAWDCSGLVQAAFKQVGVDLPRVSEDQSNYGTDVSLSNIQPGDILYWGGKGSAYHVGVYLGAGKYLDAANPSKGVVIQDLSGYPASGAVRVL